MSYNEWKFFTILTFSQVLLQQSQEPYDSLNNMLIFLFQIVSVIWLVCNLMCISISCGKDNPNKYVLFMQ